MAPAGCRSWWLTCAAAPSGSRTAPAGRRSWWLTCTTARFVSGSLGVPYGHRSWLPAFVLAGVLVEEALDGLPVDGLRGRRGVACAHRVRVALPLGRSRLVCAWLRFGVPLFGSPSYGQVDPSEVEAARASYRFAANRIVPTADDFPNPVARRTLHPLMSGARCSSWSSLARFHSITAACSVFDTVSVVASDAGTRRGASPTRRRLPALGDLYGTALSGSRRGGDAVVSYLGSPTPGFPPARE